MPAPAGRRPPRSVNSGTGSRSPPTSRLTRVSEDQSVNAASHSFEGYTALHATLPEFESSGETQQRRDLGRYVLELEDI